METLLHLMGICPDSFAHMDALDLFWMAPGDTILSLVSQVGVRLRMILGFFY